MRRSHYSRKPIQELEQWMEDHHANTTTGAAEWGQDDRGKFTSWPTGCPACNGGPVVVRLSGDEAKCLACKRDAEALAEATVPPGAEGDAEAGRDVGYPRRRVKGVRLSDVRPERVTFLEDGRIPEGAVTLLAGRPDQGKSTYTCMVAAKMSHHYPVAMLAGEDSLATTVRPRVAAAGGNLDNVHCLSMEDEHGEGDLRLPDDEKELRKFVERHGVRLLTVDPIMAHLGGKIDGHRDQDTRAALSPLRRLGQELGVTVVVVMHFKKGGEQTILNMIGGSVGFGGVARSALAFAHDPDDPDGKQGDQRILIHAKSNVGRLQPTRVYRLASAKDGDVETSRLDYLNDSDRMGEEALLPAAEAQQEVPLTREQAAAGWLREKLAGEPRATSVVEADAKLEGISKRTLERARKDLGVRSERRSTGYWLSLPDAPTEGALAHGKGDVSTDEVVLSAKSEHTLAELADLADLKSANGHGEGEAETCGLQGLSPGGSLLSPLSTDDVVSSANSANSANPPEDLAETMPAVHPAANGPPTGRPSETSAPIPASSNGRPPEAANGNGPEPPKYRLDPSLAAGLAGHPSADGRRPVASADFRLTREESDAIVAGIPDTWHPDMDVPAFSHRLMTPVAEWPSGPPSSAEEAAEMARAWQSVDLEDEAA